MEIKLQTPVQTQLIKLFQPAEISERSKAALNKFSEIAKNGGLGSAKSISVDLSGLSSENRLLTVDTAPSKKVTTYSGSFIKTNYDNVADDAVYKIDGVEFSKNEADDARKVLRNAVSYLPTSGSNLDYQDYASMGIAVSSVSSWADKNLTETQSGVIKKTIQNYAVSLVDSESEYQKSTGVSIDESKYYGATISNDDTDKMINQMKEQLSKITGKTYTPSYGNIVTQQSATNRELTSAVKNLFENIDLSNPDSVQKAYREFKEMVTPAYNSRGITSLQNGLENVLGFNIGKFAMQISGSNVFLANMNDGGIDISV